MRVELDRHGCLSIVGETTVESYALTHWHREWNRSSATTFRVECLELDSGRLDRRTVTPSEDPAPSQSNAIAWEMRARELKVYLREILSWRILQGTMADEHWNPMQEVRLQAAAAVGMQNHGGNAIWDAK